MIADTRILIVEESIKSPTRFETKLQFPGRQIIHAKPGRETLDLAMEADPAVIILDMEQTEKNGFKTALLLKECPKTAPIPLIFITPGITEDFSVFRGYLAGAWDHIPKPLNFEKLSEKIEIFEALFRERKNTEKKYNSREDCSAAFLKQKKQSHAENRKEMQTQIQMGRMAMLETLSKLAGGIAHQFNNNLSIINGAVQLLELDFEDSQRIEHFSSTILKSTEHMACLTRQLLAYARGGKFNPKLTHLPLLVKNTLYIMKGSIPESVTIITDTPGDTGDILADSSQIEMIIQGIVNNAVEATNSDGRIEIRTSNARISKKTSDSMPGMTPGEYVCIQVSDNGKGMDEDTTRKIFEPFFTTYFQGRGLGMAAVYGIVKSHNGWIGVTSSPNKGTQVAIFFPKVADRHSVQKATI